MLSIHCPAKINLVLEVREKRPDGYHNIRTIFQSLECGDRLSAEPASGFLLAGAEGITDSPDDNLIIRAARHLKEKFGVRQGIRFELEKNLPMGAGLGGGSSDAAGALILCDTIWRLGLSKSCLMEEAAKIGADVPFFINRGTCFAEGIGELLSPAPAPAALNVVIGTPFCSVSTKKAYQALSLKKDPEYEAIKREYLKHHKLHEFFKKLYNDFEPTVFQEYPEVSQLFALMNSFTPIKTLLCGSGSSLFSLFSTKKDADECEKKIRNLCRFSCVTEFQHLKY